MELIWLLMRFTAGSSTKAAAARVASTSSMLSVAVPITVSAIIYPIITAIQTVSIRSLGTLLYKL